MEEFDNNNSTLKGKNVLSIWGPYLHTTERPVGEKKTPSPRLINLMKLRTPQLFEEIDTQNKTSIDMKMLVRNLSYTTVQDTAEIKPFIYYNKFGKDIKRLLFSYVNLNEKSICCSVCKEWRDTIFQFYPLDWVQMSVKFFILYCNKIQNLSNSYIAMLDHRNGLIAIQKKLEIPQEKLLIIDSDKKGRVTYLIETITEFHNVLKLNESVFKKGIPEIYLTVEENKKSEMNMMNSFAKLTDIFKDVIFDAYSLFAQICVGDIEMNKNFDMVELTIRRYYIQLSRMFLAPAASNVPTLTQPALIIEDPVARAVWIDRFGPTVYWVPFQEFSQKIITELSNKKKIREAIEFVTHFPANGCVTTFAFHLLVCHWGPYKSISKNIEKFALKEGFLGLLNSFAAKEQIQEFQDLVYMIRFSRYEPELLTFSFGSSRKPVTHLRKPKNSSIQDFLLDNKKMGKPIPIFFSWGKANTNSVTLRTYVESPSQYCIIAV